MKGSSGFGDVVPWKMIQVRIELKDAARQLTVARIMEALLARASLLPFSQFVSGPVKLSLGLMDSCVASGDQWRSRFQFGEVCEKQAYTCQEST